MDTLLLLMPPAWLVRLAVAGVCLYEGLWRKILGRSENELRVVLAVPRYGERFGRAFLMTLGRVALLLGRQWIGFGMNHLDLLSRRGVYAGSKKWLGAPGQ